MGTAQVTSCSQLPVAHAHTLPPSGSRDLRSLPVALVLPVMRNGTFCTTTRVRKKTRETVAQLQVAHAHNILPVRASSGHVTHVTSGLVNDVTSGLVTSGRSTSLHLRKCDLNCPHILLTNYSFFFILRYFSFPFNILVAN